MNPKVSIILLNLNQADLTLDCIASLKKCSYSNIEIIVIDQNSKDNSAERLADIPGIIFIASKTNLGFTGGNNLGMKRATGDFFLLLNNDTEVHPDFLQPLVDALLIDSHAGAASPLIRYYHQPDYIQYAGGPDRIDVVLGRNSWKGWMTKEVHTNQVEETTAAHGAAFMIKKSVAKKIGLLDDNFFIYFEELDWSMRVTQNNMKILFVPQAEVYHKESMTMPKEHPFRVRMMARNRILLSRKHASLISFLLSWLYVVTVSIPINSFRYIIKGKKELLKAYTQGSLQGLLNLKYTIN